MRQEADGGKRLGTGTQFMTTPSFSRSGVDVYCGDAAAVLATLPDGCAQTCITSPPYYGLRDYGADGQIGLEASPDEYVSRLLTVFDQVMRVLRDDGALWLNLGDSYAGNGTGTSNHKGFPTTRRVAREAICGHNRYRGDGIKGKDLMGIPWMVAFALRRAGWYLRQDIVWHKPSPMPESVRDRCTKAHEYIFLMSKRPRYYFDAQAIAEPSMAESEKRYNYAFTGRAGLIMPDGNRQRPAPEGMREYSSTRNKRSVWTVASKPYPEAHFATYPPKLIEPCIKAGCPEGGTVLDPFAGSGTTGQVAIEQGRRAVLIELNQDYLSLIRERLEAATAKAGLFSGVTQ